MGHILFLPLGEHLHLSQGVASGRSSLLQQQAHIAGLGVHTHHLGGVVISGAFQSSHGLPLAGIVGSLHHPLHRRQGPLQPYLPDGQAAAQVGIDPLLAAVAAHPHAAERAGGKHLHGFIVGIEQLQLMHIPMGGAVHLHHEAEMFIQEWRRG